MRSLRTWLALGLVVGILAPTCAGAAGWLAAGAWQAQRQLARRDAAVRLLAGASIDDPSLLTRLGALGVEAELAPAETFPPVSKDTLLRQMVTTPGLRTALEGREGKRALEHFASYPVSTGHIDATLWLRPPSVAARWASALGTAGVALVAVLLVAVALLQRWVVRPLARMAADADRMAGGELAVTPLRTRAREVAQVGEALGGMAGALTTALGASAAAERDRRFLVSAIAHDLRTPLFTLRGSLEAIERGMGEGSALARAQRKADHLDRLVGDLFAFSRAEYAHEAYTAEPVDLAEIARRAIETAAPAARHPIETAPGPAVPAAGAPASGAPVTRTPDAPSLAAGAPAAASGPHLAARVRVELRAAGPVPLRGDAVGLERVLTNVLDNAVRHARSWVRVEVRREGGAAVAEVVDDGPGFAPEDLAHVFEPLFRGDRARPGGGAGLGLAIARRLARSHGGDVFADNEAGGGARVIARFPTTRGR